MIAGPESPVRVELRYAGLPLIGAFAVHYWFVVFEGGKIGRWEVWQTKNAGGESIGHVHSNLKPPDAGVGGGPMRVAAAWEGEQALRIKQVFEKISSYPHCQRYAPWPGPNSNTFAAWVLAQAGIDYRLGIRGHGRNYGRKRARGA